MQIQQVSKAEQVRRAILREILSGRLRPGQRLLEAQLSKELGVSQATVNGALQDLHNQGLVTKLLNRSSNVARFTLADIERLFAVRILLEPAATAAVAAEHKDGARAWLEKHIEGMRRAARAHDLEGFCIADYEFHQEIYRLSGNPFLEQAGQAIAAAPFAFVLCDHPDALPTDYVRLAEDHQEIVEAIVRGPAEAAKAMHQRIQLWLEYSRRALQEGSAGEERVRVEQVGELR